MVWGSAGRSVDWKEAPASVRRLPQHSSVAAVATMTVMRYREVGKAKKDATRYLRQHSSVTCKGTKEKARILKGSEGEILQRRTATMMGLQKKTRNGGEI